MENGYIRDFFDADESHHDAEWFSRTCRFVRWHGTPLVDARVALQGMAYLYAEQDMRPTMALFQNPPSLNLANNNQTWERIPYNDMTPDKLHPIWSGVPFTSLPIMPKKINILISEIKKMGILTTVTATDPTSKEQKHKDKILIKNKEKIENDLSKIYTSIGKKPYKMEDHESRFGEKLGSGNIEDFISMGLDHKDPQDIKFFMDFFHKLKQEVAIQDVIDFINKFNDVPNALFELMCRDFLAKNAMCLQPFITEDGIFQYRYIAPECFRVYGVTGRRQDYNDSQAKWYEQKMTIKETLQTIGNSLDLEKNWEFIMQSICYTNGVQFTGIIPSYSGLLSGATYDYPANWGNGNGEGNGTQSRQWGYGDFFQFMITIGFMQISSQIDEGMPVDNEASYSSGSNKPANDDKYQSKSKYKTPLYEAYYLATSALSQVLFNFQPVPYSDILGFSDVNNNFTLLCYKLPGIPLVLQCAREIDLCNELYYKMWAEVRRAQPPGTDYNYDSIIQLAEDLIVGTEKDRDMAAQQVINFLDGSANKIHKFVEIEGRQIAISNNQLNIPLVNGLSPNFPMWFDTYQKILANLDEMLGLSPLRQGDPGNERDSPTIQLKAMESSQGATYFLPDGISIMLEQVAQRCLLYAIDVIQFKDKNTLPYNFLLDGVGQKTLDSIEELGLVSPTRFGIFFESLSQSNKKTLLNQATLQALQAGKIDYIDMVLILDIDNPRKAFITLAYLSDRKAKIAQKNAMQAQQAQGQQAMQLKQLELKQEQMKGDYQLENTKLLNAGSSNDHIINAKSGLAKEQLKQQGDKDLIATQAEADLNLLRAQNNQALNVPTPALPQTQPAPQQGNQPPLQLPPQGQPMQAQ